MEENMYGQNYGDNQNGYDEGSGEIQRETNQTVNNKPKKKKKQKQKATAGTIIKRILLGILIGIVSLVAIAYSVLYFAFDIEFFTTAIQVKKVNEKVEVDKKFQNQFSDDDLKNINGLINSNSLLDSAFIISDKQIGAFVDDKINNLDNETNEEFAFISKYGLDVIQVDFSNKYLVYPGIEKDYLIDMNIVIKLDITNLKNSELSSFPKSLIKNLIPNEIYISSTVEVFRDGDSYKLVKKDLLINNLGSNDSTRIIKTLNNFIKVGTADELCIKICDPFAKYIFGDFDDKSLFDKFEKFGAKSFGIYYEGNDYNLIIYKHKITDVASIEYNNTKGATNDNKTTYSVTDNNIFLNPISSAGYEFLGWYNGEGEDSHEISSINAWDLKFTQVYAKWKIIEYTIAYDMRGSTTAVPNPTTYTIEDEINLQTPYKAVEAEFKGWTFKYTDTRELVAGYGNPDTNGKIKKGTYGNLTIYARFDDERILELYADGKFQDDIDVIIGEPISFEQITANFDSSKVGMSGYSVSKWYTDKELTNEYNYDNLVKDDMVLYGEWEYVVNVLKFYPYISEFDQGIASSKKTIEIDSREEFEAYFEYARFYNIKDTVNLKFSYLSEFSQVENSLNEIMDSFNNNNSLNIGASVSYSPNLFNGVVEVKLTTKCDEYAKLVMDAEKSQVKIQQNNALALTYEKKRADDFDDFKINNVTKTINVTTSYQLAYCLEQGYRPICKAGSSAEVIYNKAKAVLRNICDDEMTDIEKLLAMFEWLTLNVSYDQKAYKASSNMTASEAYRYNSWFAEGVFNSGVAVCEGYAKAFIIMARLEGIPMVLVTGNVHAWNKVLVNGKWYGIDATHGDLTVSEMEVVNYREFLFSDSYKEGKNYPTTDYSEFVANESFEFFDNTTYSYDGESFDLYIEDNSELDVIVDYLLYVANANKYTDFTFGLEFKSNVNTTMSLNILAFKLKAEISTTPPMVKENGNIVYVIICKNV